MEIKFRAIEVEDLPLLRDWRNLKKIRRVCREYRLLNMINQKDWLERISKENTNQMFAIEYKEIIGVCGLTHIDWKNRHAELSYYVGKDLPPLITGKIAIKIYDFLKDKAFNEYNLNRLWGEIYEFNEVAIKLAQKNGLKIEGRLKETYFWDGRYWDSIIVGMVAKDYERRMK